MFVRMSHKTTNTKIAAYNNQTPRRRMIFLRGVWRFINDISLYSDINQSLIVRG